MRARDHLRRDNVPRFGWDIPRRGWQDRARSYMDAVVLADEQPVARDAWKDSDGCWADRWYEHTGEYLPCDWAPDPESPLGLCGEHEAMMKRRQASTDQAPAGASTAEPERREDDSPALIAVTEQFGRQAWMHPAYPDRVLIDGEGVARIEPFSLSLPNGNARIVVEWSPPTEEETRATIEAYMAYDDRTR